MHFTTQEELLQMAILSEEIPMWLRKRAGEVLRENKAYAPEATALVHTYFSRQQKTGFFEESREESVVNFSGQDSSPVIVMFDCDTIVMRISDQLRNVIGKSIPHTEK